MDPELLKNNPLRPPQWRSERVMQMIAHRPRPLKPRRCDDHNVRIYRRLLLECIGAGTDENRREAVFREYPEISCAHLIHFSPNLELRQILEARLLTNESFEEIAQRFATTPEAIKYYEGLFFNVRDRLDKPGWISAMILRPPAARANATDSVMTEEERGFVYRWFGYIGGPLALDAVIDRMSGISMPRSPQDVSDWFDSVLDWQVKTAATIAASVLKVTDPIVMQLLELAMRASASGAKDRSEGLNEYERRVKSMLESVNITLAGSGSRELNQVEQAVKTTPIEPRASEQITIANGVMPETLQRAIDQHEAGRAAQLDS